jgi:hypothetical protein
MGTGIAGREDLNTACPRKRQVQEYQKEELIDFTGALISLIPAQVGLQA